MATIERSGFSERELSTASPNVPLDPNVASTQGRMFSEIGKVGEDLGEMFTKAQILAEQTKSQNEFEKSLAEHELRASLIDISQLKPDQLSQLKTQFNDEIGKSLKNSSEHISFERARGQYLLEQEKNAEISKRKIESIFINKKMDNWKTELNNYTLIQGQNYIHANTPLERENSVLELKTLIGRKLATGFISSAVEAKNEELKTLANWDKKKVFHEAHTNPEKFKDDVSKGFYDGVDQEAVDKSIESADKFIKKNNKVNGLAYKQRVKMASDNLTEEYILSKGNMDPAIVKENELNGLIPPKLAKSLMKGHESDLGIDSATDIDTYRNLVKSMHNPDGDPEEIRRHLIDSNSEGKLSKADMAELYQLKLIPTNNGQYTSVFKIFGEDITTRDLENTRKSTMARAIDYIERLSPAFSLYSTLKDFIKHVGSKGVSDKEIPKIAYEFIKQYRLKNRPDIASYPEEGKRLIDGQGNVATVFPDGSIDTDKEDEEEQSD